MFTIAKQRAPRIHTSRKWLEWKNVRLITNNAYVALRNQPAVLDSCFNLSTAFTDNAASKGYSVDDFLVYPNFISKEMHKHITSICEKKLRKSLGLKVEYHPQHDDRVIHQYRECSASNWGKADDYMNDFTKTTIYSMFPERFEWLDPHILGKMSAREHEDVFRSLNEFWGHSFMT